MGPVNDFQIDNDEQSERSCAFLVTSSSSGEESDTSIKSDANSFKIIKTRLGEDLRPRKATRSGSCQTKNAVMARQNRQRKKAYLKSLEDEVTTLKQCYSKLKTEMKTKSKDVKKLRKENIYLKSVLKNSTDLTRLVAGINSSLKNLRKPNSNQVTPLVSESPLLNDVNLDQTDPLLSTLNEDSQVGICLHMAQGQVALTFCSRCSMSALNDELYF